jgi:two-component system, sensor histidine kinase
MEKWLELIELSSCSCKILDSLISNAEDYTGFETDQFVPKFSDFELMGALLEIQEVSMPMTINTGIEFTIQRKKGVPEIIRTDRSRLISVLVVLIQNAFKYTKEGFVKLVISLSEQNKLKFLVQDTGIGIPEHKQKQLFKLFVNVLD